MYLLYYDEVKLEPKKQPYFWLGAICVDATNVSSIEDEVNDISEATFGSRLLDKTTEFHGKEIVGKKGNFKGWTLEKRLKVLEALLAIIAKDEVKCLYIKIVVEKLHKQSRTPHETAFMFLIERADKLFKSLDSVGMLFGDYDQPFIGPSVASLSRYRQGGTDWTLSCKIENIIDTVHFARSHHSRMIQLADVFLSRKLISVPALIRVFKTSDRGFSAA